MRVRTKVAGEGAAYSRTVQRHTGSTQTSWCGWGSGNTTSAISLATRTVMARDNRAGVALSGDKMVCIVCEGFYNDFNNPGGHASTIVAVVNPVTHARLASLAMEGRVSALSLSPDGRGSIQTTDRDVTIHTRSSIVAGTFLT